MPRASHLQLVRPGLAVPPMDEAASRPGAHGVFTGPAARPGWTRVLVMDRTAGLVSDADVLADRVSSTLLKGLELFFLGSDNTGRVQ